MLPDAVLPVPASLMTLLAWFAPLFTAPSFRTFTMLACGFLAQSGKRTVCGMLTGAGLSRLWPHDRAHYFFSRARWNPDDLGIAVAKLVIALLVPDGEPVEVLVDDTLFRRRGKKVWAASWFHDGSAQGPAKTGYGNNWVVLAVRVRLPMISRPVAVPVMAKLVIKGTASASRLWLARRMVTRLAAELPGRQVHVTADSAYAGAELKELPDGVTWTTRLRSNAALCGLPPERTGRKGRPRVKGDRLPSLAKIAAAAVFSQVTVTRYGKTETIAVHALHLPVVLRHRRERRSPSSSSATRRKTGFDLALVTTEKNPDTAHCDRKIRRQMGYRSRDRGREAALRHRAGPQPHRPRGRAHDPVHARLPGPRRHLVRHRWAPPCRRRGPPPGRALVHVQDRAVHRRHDRQAPPRHHRRQI